MVVSLPLPQRGYLSREHTKIITEAIKVQSIIGIGAYSQQIIAGVDVLYYATITLQNVQAGGIYWIAQSSNLTNVLATGTQGGTSANIVISNVPGLLLAETITVRVRGYGTIKYLPFETQAVLTRSGVSVFVSQVIDAIGT